jgi:hypothetical protein
MLVYLPANSGLESHCWEVPSNVYKKAGLTALVYETGWKGMFNTAFYAFCS